jgi:putative transposase
MASEPQVPDRQSIRLRVYDYSQPGMYYVTLCAHGKKCVFGEAIGGCVGLSVVGDVVRQCWQQIPDHFPHVELDEYVIMPNHIHGILVVKQAEGRGECETSRHFRQKRAWHAKPLQEAQFGHPMSRTIGTIMGSFKSATTKEVRRKTGETDMMLWQRNYYEHIIKSQSGLDHIRRYIAENPANWGADEENPVKAIV